MSDIFGNRGGGEPAFTQRVTKVKNEAGNFALGDRVEHAQYGIGTIVSIS